MHHGAQCRSVMHNVVLYHWIGVQHMSYVTIKLDVGRMGKLAIDVEPPWSWQCQKCDPGTKTEPYDIEYSVLCIELKSSFVGADNKKDQQHIFNIKSNSRPVSYAISAHKEPRGQRPWRPLKLLYTEIIIQGMKVEKASLCLTNLVFHGIDSTHLTC